MIFYFIVVIGVLACSASQLLLKRSALMPHERVMGAILNWRVLLSYSIMFLTLVMNIFAMKNGVQLKDMPVLESTGYIFVPLLSSFFLSEKISRKGILSILLVLVGIVLFYL